MQRTSPLHETSSSPSVCNPCPSRLARTDLRREPGIDDEPYESDYSLRQIDMQLRRYQKAGRTGLYAGAFVRYSHIEGEPFVDVPYAMREFLDYSRGGTGVVFGLRGFLQIRQIKRRIFWGANVHLGRWLNGSPTPLRYEYGPLEDLVGLVRWPISEQLEIALAAITRRTVPGLAFSSDADKRRVRAIS